MRNRAWLVVWAGAAMATGAACPAYAQVLKPIIFNFAVPNQVDPLSVVFTSPGTQAISGADLIGNPDVPFSIGTEVHSRIPGPNGGFLDINSLEIQFNYTGQISINPPPGPAITPGYVNWTVQSLSVIDNHYDIVFVNPFPPFSAPINDNFDPGNGNPFHESFAGLGVTSDPASLAAFVAQNPEGDVLITAGNIGLERGGNVPEPGAAALLSGLGVTAGGWLMARRRKARRKA